MFALVRIVEAIVDHIDRKREARRNRLMQGRLIGREMGHAGIPGSDYLRQLYGSRYEELHALFILHDPASIQPKNASANHVSDSVRWQYDRLTRTVIFRLVAMDKPGPSVIAELLQQELEVWFEKSRHPALKEHSPNGLVAQVVSLRARWDFL
jgi:hypothetical protein